MIFVLVFSALAVSMSTLSGTNLQIAENQRKADSARGCAESGVEIIRFWLNRFSVAGATEQSLVFNELASHASAHSLQSDLTANTISNITTSYDGTTLTIPNVTLDSENSKSFSAVITQLDADTLQMDVTGVYKTLTRTIRANYNFGVRLHTVFDYGVATKGPLHLAGNIELEGANVQVESDVYIVSEYSNLALEIIGNSSIAGEVHISNPLATADLQGGQASVGGETVPEAYEHITSGIGDVEFPVPNPEYFEHYVAEDINLTETTFVNVRIPPNTNPFFAGGVTFNGVVFIETPNVVTFSGHVNITGIIVGDGNINDDSGANRIDFLGTVNSNPVDDLPGSFGELVNETGTFLMAPGFSTSFQGDFETINGAIAANGIDFSGNAGGIIEGSVLNYSDQAMDLSGNNSLVFNRYADTEIPAGFEPEIVLKYVHESYSEGPF
jgi:hypothetical protein